MADEVPLRPTAQRNCPTPDSSSSQPPQRIADAQVEGASRGRDVGNKAVREAASRLVDHVDCTKHEAEAAWCGQHKGGRMDPVEAREACDTAQLGIQHALPVHNLLRGDCCPATRAEVCRCVGMDPIVALLQLNGEALDWSAEVNKSRPRDVDVEVCGVVEL
eukprot:6868949-Prymnesium_polylepis.5